MNKDFKELIVKLGYHELEKKLTEEYINYICDNDLFWKNIDILVNKYGNDTLKILKIINSVNTKYINDKLEYLIPYYIDDKIDYDYMFLLRNTDLNRIVNYLIENNFILKTNKLFNRLLCFPQDKKPVFDNIDFFINNSIDILGLKKILSNVKGIDAIIDKINTLLDNNPERIIEGLVFACTKLTLEDLKEEKLLDTFKTLLKELIVNEGINYHDIKPLDRGAYSNVILVGNKVLKAGKRRSNFSIKHNKRFLKPLYRQEINSIYNNDVLLCVEITEKVDTENVTHADLYDIYKELRDEGLIWYDCHLSNIGRLIRDNNIYYEGIERVDINATGYLTDNTEVLKKGNIVIIDNDYIFTEEEFQNLFKNGKTLTENIASCEGISDLEYQYQYEKAFENNQIELNDVYKNY